MSVAAVPRLMTTEEFLALPNDGAERWLSQGQPREKPGAGRGQPAAKPLTSRNRWHSRVLARVTKFLDNWLDGQPEPRGSVLCGDAEVGLRHDPDGTAGVDVVYLAAEGAGRQDEDAPLLDGAPVLAAEILSPDDTQQEVNEKIDRSLRAGVALVWVIDPHRRTVTVFRPGEEPELVNARQELSGEPHLPGFRVPVAHFFA
jgi:Uma2 family endonuclease